MIVRRPLAAFFVLVLVLAGCGIPVEDSARTLSADEIPSSLPSPTSAPTSPPADPSPASAEVFFVRGSRLAPVRREVSVPPSVEGTITALLTRPTPDERSQGLRTALPGEVRLAGTVAAGIPLIDVTESFAQVEGEEQILALAQVVFTLTGLPGVEGVSFALTGRPVEVPTGDGTLKRGPLRRQDFAAVAPLG